MTKDDRHSVIARGTSLQGTLTSDCPVTVSGVVDGEFSGPCLVVTDSGSIHGKVRADELHSSGEIAGDIDVGVLQLSGRVRDNTAIRTKSLEVKLDSAGNDRLRLIFGTATLEVGAEPAE